MTNYHVVRQAKGITVAFQGDTKVGALLCHSPSLATVLFGVFVKSEQYQLAPPNRAVHIDGIKTRVGIAYGVRACEYGQPLKELLSNSMYATTPRCTPPSCWGMTMTKTWRC